MNKIRNWLGHHEPVELRSLPVEVRQLVHAVDRFRDGWAESGEARQAELWRQLHQANEAVWGRQLPLLWRFMLRRQIKGLVPEAAVGVSAVLPVPEPNTGGPDEVDAPVLPAGCSVEPRTGVPADGKASDGLEALRDASSGRSTWDQVEALAAILEPDAFNPDQAADERWREATKFVALAHAAKVITSSDYRRLVEDDDTTAGKVREFHVAFDLPINDATRTLNKLRADLIREEAEETAEAVEAGDLEHIAKELADLAYVTYGAALTLGIDLDRAVAEVHRSNMSKLVDGKPVMRPDGKVLKGPSYREPDMRAAVRALREET